jgi:hypothetical protein
VTARIASTVVKRRKDHPSQYGTDEDIRRNISDRMGHSQCDNHPSFLTVLYYYGPIRHRVFTCTSQHLHPLGDLWPKQPLPFSRRHATPNQVQTAFFSSFNCSLDANPSGIVFHSQRV